MQVRALLGVNQFDIFLPSVGDSSGSSWQEVRLGGILMDTLEHLFALLEESVVSNFNESAFSIGFTFFLGGAFTRNSAHIDFFVFSGFSVFFIDEFDILSIFSGHVPGFDEEFEPERFIVGKINNISVGYSLWEFFIVTIVAVLFGVFAALLNSWSSLLIFDFNSTKLVISYIKLLLSHILLG